MKENLALWIGARLEAWHGAQRNAIVFFLAAVLRVETFVIAKVGQCGTAGTDTLPRHGIKRANRLLANKRISTELMCDTSLNNFKSYIKNRKTVTLVIDWTTLKEKYNICCVSYGTKYKRCVPVLSSGYKKCEMDETESQNKIEIDLLTKILMAIPPSKTVTIIADRGFDRADLARFLMSFNKNIRFVIRVKQDKIVVWRNKEIEVSADMIQKGEKKNYGWVYYTKTHHLKVRFAVIWDINMESPWFLITNIPDVGIQHLANIYARRWDIETMFKSMKNEQSGFELKYVRLRHIERWVRLFFFVTLLFQFLWEISEKYRDDIDVDKAFTNARHRKGTRQYNKRNYSIYYISILLIRCEKIRLENRNGRIRITILLNHKSGDL